MKLTGLIGGLSWESTAHYYRLLNQLVRERLGGHQSAKVLLYSMNFAEVRRLQSEERWDEATQHMLGAARSLERGGAEAILICTNTMHICAPEVQANLSIPLLHIADVAGQTIASRGIRRVALLGTSFTMEKDFYVRRLRERFDLDPIVPNADGRSVVHNIIFDELVHGIVKPESKSKCRSVISELERDGAEGVLLGCTELMMLLGERDSGVPVFDTTAMHCKAAIDWALSA